jgi:hypothetical protein
MTTPTRAVVKLQSTRGPRLHVVTVQVRTSTGAKTLRHTLPFLVHMDGLSADADQFQRVIKAKPLLKIKYKPGPETYANVDKFKVRIVVQGLSKLGVVLDRIYSLVAHNLSIRLVLALSIKRG